MSGCDPSRGSQQVTLVLGVYRYLIKRGQTKITGLTFLHLLAINLTKCVF
jgi:hypothetical protein